jgi:hypothetical protein
MWRRAMFRSPAMRSRKDAMAEDEPKSSPLRAVVGLGLIVALILGVLFLMNELRHASAIQDCVASGRSNCAPISSGR